MPLQSWLRNGWLTAHKTDPQEIGNLLTVADRDLEDCQARGLSADWRLNIAYNAALQAATAALAAAGYRAVRDAHHFRIIQSLIHTVHISPELVALFDQFRKKRNLGGYERAGLVSDEEAREMLLLAGRLRKDIEGWLRESHPELMV